jgi:hypothetical protein
VAPADPAEFRGINELRDPFEHVWPHATQARMEEQWFVVLDQEVTELEIDVRVEDTDAIDVGSDFGDGRHAKVPSYLRPSVEADFSKPAYM